ncbi:MAG: redoxin domain-containing protein [Planctomycetota bacterium]|nr:redoxin domain-containing protein [Planctomycetota bacterium]
MMHRTCLHTFILSAILAICPSVIAQTSGDDESEDFIGHSGHGEAYDVGPRQKPWVMEGIGTTHFPITTKVPEVQTWFDQGNTLLHSFWYYEAERSFRWCLKLDPECAMAYWGLARAAASRGGSERAVSILKEAIRRKDSVTDRERMYIEVWEDAMDPISGRIDFETLASELEELVIAFPDDNEAKTVFLLYSLWGSSKVGNDRIGQQVLAVEPEHIGAHHYLIHNWDDGEHGDQAMDNCENFGRIAWNVGHANHMPGHIYSGLGMYHEGAIWMDRATRVEKKYMQQRMTFPFNMWNYAHNRNYLAYIQEQLGMAEASLQGARDLMNAPLDPEYNKGDGGYVHQQGRTALIRALVKFERWEEILEGDTIKWQDDDRDRPWRAYAEGLAHLRIGQLFEARGKLHELQAIAAKPPEGGGERGRRFGSLFTDIQRKELESLIMLEDGKVIGGLRLLAEAAEAESEAREQVDDPAVYPQSTYNLLGEQYLRLNSPTLAAAAFEKTLERVPNDGWALSGMAQAYASMGDTARASEAYGRMLHVWSDADPGLRWKDAADALGLVAEPLDQSPRLQRNYKSQTLDEFGPNVWEPYPAPKLEAPDPEGNLVTLDSYRGGNVLLVFYIGEQCTHCIDQLNAINNRINEFTLNDTQVIAISSDAPEVNKESEVMEHFNFPLLSDVEHINARRFKSYDDFEDLELHSTILIDKEGRIRWSRNGGEPFMDLDFIFSELKRIETIEFADQARAERQSSAESGSP